MGTHHYREDSPKPEIKDGEITLFSMRFCPYVHRVHLVLSAKNQAYNTVSINLMSKPKWYADFSPNGKVPVLLYNGEILNESLLLADFINEEFPAIPLYPSDPIRKLKDKMLIEKFTSVASTFYKITIMTEFDEESFRSFTSYVNNFEQELTKRNTKYFGGNERPMMIDYMIWPWFEKSRSLPLLFDDRANLWTKKFPNLEKWIALMESDPSVLKHYLTPEKHAEFYRLCRAKKLDACDV